MLAKCWSFTASRKWIYIDQSSWVNIFCFIAFYVLTLFYLFDILLLCLELAPVLSQPCLSCEMIEMGNAMALGDGTCDSCGRITSWTCDSCGRITSWTCDSCGRITHWGCDSCGKMSSLTCDSCERMPSWIFDSCGRMFSWNCDSFGRMRSWTCNSYWRKTCQTCYNYSCTLDS